MVPNSSFSTYDLILCLSEAVDLVSPLVADHHKRVSYVSYSLCKEMGWPEDTCKQVCIAGALHDVGGLSLKSRTDALAFELEAPYEHAEAGYLLLRKYPLFQKAASFIRMHHTRWENGKGRTFLERDVPQESHLLHLADRISVLVEPDQEILSQQKRIQTQINQVAGSMFIPDMVDAFNRLSNREYFWFNLISPTVDLDLRRDVKWKRLSFGEQQVNEMALFFSTIIDFKSPFTATHSVEVAATAETMARLAGFSEEECFMMRIAGYLHDLGKLSVPSEVLDKPTSLTQSESRIIVKHAFYTDHILKSLDAFVKIRQWAALHHERLDGSGYPYHLKTEDICPGSRIIAISDVYAALAQDRPYRKQLPDAKITQILTDQVQSGKLDGGYVNLLLSNLQVINAIRIQAREKVIVEYEEFSREMGKFQLLCDRFLTKYQ